MSAIPGPFIPYAVRIVHPNLHAALPPSIPSIEDEKNVPQPLGGGQDDALAQSFLAIAQGLENEGKLLDAEKLYTAALQFTSRGEDYAHLPRLFEKKGERERAAKAYVLLADLYLKERKPTEAIAALKKSLELVVDPSIKEKLAAVLKDNGRPQEAAVLFLELAQQMLYNQNTLKSAFFCHQALEAFPGCPEIWQAMAALQYSPSDAIQILLKGAKESSMSIKERIGLCKRARIKEPENVEAKLLLLELNRLRIEETKLRIENGIKLVEEFEGFQWDATSELGMSITYYNCPILNDAILEGDETWIVFLLDLCSIDLGALSLSCDGRTATTIGAIAFLPACSTGNVKIASTLLARGVDLFQLSSWYRDLGAITLGEEAIEIAYRNNHRDLFDLLCEKVVPSLQLRLHLDKNSISFPLEDICEQACERRQVDIVKMLINGINIQKPKSGHLSFGFHLLCKAANANSRGIVNLLLCRGVPVQEKTYCCNSVTITAILLRTLEIRTWSYTTGG